MPMSCSKTAYHESHRLLARFLTKGEMRMLSKLRNKKRGRDGWL